jgi:hypothetical protein
MADVISRPLIVKIDSERGGAVQGKVLFALSDCNGLHFFWSTIANHGRFDLGENMQSIQRTPFEIIERDVKPWRDIIADDRP